MSDWEQVREWEDPGAFKPEALENSNFNAPGPSKDFAPLKEQHNDGYYAGERDAYARNDTCRNCGQPGHFARECSEPRKGSGPCFNCGEEGHNKADCPKPRVFKGTCRICNEEGHPAMECPQRAPDVCKNCRKEGHKTSECKDNRSFDLNDVPDKTPQEAWAALKKADAERDLDDFRDAFRIYAKAEPAATFVDIEKQLRDEKANIYLIALEKQKEGFESYTLIDLQGKLDRTYVVSFFFEDKPKRANYVDRWPESADQNLERLEDAGFAYDRMIPKCGNCGELGHGSRSCKKEREPIERLEVKCVVCNEAGHRARDCTQERKFKFACRNCGAEDHKASECPEPKSMAGVECRRCNETGHFAKDCPSAPAQFAKACRRCGAEDHLARECTEEQNMNLITCKNCDATGHYSRDCPKPRDYSRVKCNNCGEMGHTVKRCTQPVPEEDMAFADEQEVEAAPLPVPTGTWGNADEDGGW